MQHHSFYRVCLSIVFLFLLILIFQATQAGTEERRLRVKESLRSKLHWTLDSNMIFPTICHETYVTCDKSCVTLWHMKQDNNVTLKFLRYNQEEEQTFNINIISFSRLKFSPTIYKITPSLKVTNENCSSIVNYVLLNTHSDVLLFIVNYHNIVVKIFD